ncbi:MAG: hypothetical protein ABFC63_00295 [Thermoguttaceae bacterium]
MSRWYMFAAAMAFPAVLLAQVSNSTSRQPVGEPYQPAVPPPSTSVYGGNGPWGGYGGATTAAGSALNGMAGVISAAGQRNLLNSAAAVNWTEAQKNDIENRQRWTNAYFEMRATNRAAAAADRSPRLTMEQIARLAKDGAPKPLNTSHLDPVSGGIKWPSALQQPMFDTQRNEIDRVLATQARYGVLSYSDQTKIREDIKTIFEQLKSQIDQIPPTEYVACRNFLRSVSYATTKTDL